MRVEYFFDPVCPFCWVTSRWVVDIAPDRDLEIMWRFICLRIINDGTYEAKGPEYERSHNKGRQLLRVAAAVGKDHGSERVGELYTAMGNAIWEVPRPPDGDRRTHLESFDATVVAGLLESVGLDSAYAAAMDDSAHDDVLAAESELAFERTGRDVGTPIITYGDGPSYFGPVISSVPPHDEGLRLWDGLVEVTSVATFSELKRSNRDPLDLPILRS